MNSVTTDTERRVPEQTACAIVGGGPGGAMLALLLARQGVDVTLLERQADFDRDFRGDSLHIAVLELLDELGLLDRLLTLPHRKTHRFTVRTTSGERTVADFSSIRSAHPYVVTMPQVDFINFIVAEANRYPNFHLIMNANVQDLISEGGVVLGVRYKGRDGSHDLRATLTVGADGRHSKVRHLARVELFRIAAPLDVLWFRLPMLSAQEEQPSIYAGPGYHVNVIARHDSWQIGYTIPKGGYQELRNEGIAAMREHLAHIMPGFADRLDSLTDWHQISLLSIESARVNRWYRPGLLLIGDAAHVLSPFAGSGINFAIQDAVAASNELGSKLRAGKVSARDLAAVQRKRQWPVRLVQWLDSVTQHGMSGGSPRKVATPHHMPFTRIPFFEKAMVRYIGFGLGRVRLKRATMVLTPRDIVSPGAALAPSGQAYGDHEDSANAHQTDIEIKEQAKASLQASLRSLSGLACSPSSQSGMGMQAIAREMGCRHASPVIRTRRTRCAAVYGTTPRVSKPTIVTTEMWSYSATRPGDNTYV